MGKQNDGMAPGALRERYQALVSLTDAFCSKHLDEEFAVLCRKLAADMCGRRPAPVTGGRAQTWACAIVYTLAGVNLMFDRDRGVQGGLSAGELCALFGVSQSTASNKSTIIRQAVGMRPLDVRWSLRQRLLDNPVAWLIHVNGMPLDARQAPRKLQLQALRKGLIPFLPDDA